MDVTLRRFTTEDLWRRQRWIHDVHAERYLSRFGPHGTEDGDLCSPLWVWYVIMADGADVGEVWLELERTADDTAYLGILLGREDLLGKGIGRAAIAEAVRQGRAALRFQRVRLHVRRGNDRAVACYRHCGFMVIEERVKHNEFGEAIPIYVMEMDASDPEKL